MQVEEMMGTALYKYDLKFCLSIAFSFGEGAAFKIMIHFSDLKIIYSPPLGLGSISYSVN